MVYDRTIDDVNKAKLIREEKIKHNIELSTDDLTILERGMLTVNTLNRIENKQREVALLMNDMGYYGFGIETKIWNLKDIFKVDDFKRILENLDSLKKSFFVYSTTPQTPNSKYHFGNINSIERILYDLDKMAEEIIEMYRECGNFQCNEV